VASRPRLRQQQHLPRGGSPLFLKLSWKRRLDILCEAEGREGDLPLQASPKSSEAWGVAAVGVLWCCLLRASLGRIGACAAKEKTRSAHLCMTASCQSGCWRGPTPGCFSALSCSLGAGVVQKLFVVGWGGRVVWWRVRWCGGGAAGGGRRDRGRRAHWLVRSSLEFQIVYMSQPTLYSMQNLNMDSFVIIICLNECHTKDYGDSVYIFQGCRWIYKSIFQFDGRKRHFKNSVNLFKLYMSTEVWMLQVSLKLRQRISLCILVVTVYPSHPLDVPSPYEEWIRI
jgi:hypothetical protein